MSLAQGTAGQAHNSLARSRSTKDSSIQAPTLVLRWHMTSPRGEKLLKSDMVTSVLNNKTLCPCSPFAFYYLSYIYFN